MKRRTLLKSMSLSVFAGVSVPWWLTPRQSVVEHSDTDILVTHDPESAKPDPLTGDIRRFDQSYAEDIWLDGKKRAVLSQVIRHMRRLQRHVGHAHFSLLGFDDLLRYARRYSAIGAFSQAEKDLFDEIFNYDASLYGFTGDKVISCLTANVPRKDTVKVSRSGNYLFRGDSIKMYHRLQRDVGNNMILTSGIRSVTKQMYLFLAKTLETGGNLSRASRSLAPPGYSYHGIGDFDVGQAGYGVDNFTERFAKSDAFSRLQQLTYVDIRYTMDNRFGVRFEPWHIKVV